MTTEQRQRIVDYLSGPRDHAEGVALYQLFGVNLRLKRMFMVENTSTAKEFLIDELRKLAGLSEAEFARLPRRAKSSKSVTTEVKADSADIEKQNTGEIFDSVSEAEEFLLKMAEAYGVTVDELVSPDFVDRIGGGNDIGEGTVDAHLQNLEEARSKYAATTEPVRKMIRFREKYPFLNSDDCPDILKILVADMFTAYGKYKEAHARLLELDDEYSLQAENDCKTVVEEYLKNREIWDELEYYKENGTILGKAAKFREAEAAEDYSKLSDMELVKKYQSASANVSKQKRAYEESVAAGEANERIYDALQNWQAKKSALKEEMSKRKKK